MIGKKVPKNTARAGLKSKASNIRDLTSYIADPGTEEKLLYENGRNFEAETFPGRQNEMIALAMESARSRDPVSHYVLSWREGEQPTKEQVEGSVTTLLEELGLEKHQAIYGLHRDTENIHLHIAVNRVHPTTTRVVTPNKGFDIEAVHRAIARIEHDQGWQSLPNARYMVSGDGTVTRRFVPDAPRQPSQRSRDYEQRTGAKSTERIAIERAGPILRGAASWEDVHARLEAAGMRLERKGSGALLWVGDRAVKASSVDRGASLGALEKRLGAYRGPAGEPGREQHVPAAEAPRARQDEPKRRTRGVEEVAGGALPAIRTARSWRELHEHLDALGMQYERKGSGAVVRVDGRVVKASSLHRSVGLGALETRLGPFEPSERLGRQEPGVPRPPLAEVIPLNGSPASWVEYRDARRDHYARKEAALVEQRRRHEAERAALRSAQREQRREILGMLKDPLHRQAFRSVFAAEHAAEKADLRDRHTQERQALRSAHPRYPDFEQWLRARDPAEAARWRYRATDPAKIEGATYVPATPRDIRAFAALVRGGEVHYRRAQGDAHTSFVDRGRSIWVHETQDSAAVLASLQLAAQKWGRFKVAGDDGYKRLCTRLAVQHGFQLDNPELQEELGELRAARSRSGVGGSFGGRDPRPPVPRIGSSPPPECRGQLRTIAELHQQALRETASRPGSQARQPVVVGDMRGHEAAAERGRSRTETARAGRVASPLECAVAAYGEHHQDIVAHRSAGPVNYSRIDMEIAVRMRATGHGENAITDAMELRAPMVRPASERQSHEWHEYARRTVAFAFSTAGDREVERSRPDHDRWRQVETLSAPFVSVPAVRAPSVSTLEGPDI
jgi:hypothetical protein